MTVLWRLSLLSNILQHHFLLEGNVFKRMYLYICSRIHTSVGVLTILEQIHTSSVCDLALCRPCNLPSYRRWLFTHLSVVQSLSVWLSSLLCVHIYYNSLTYMLSSVFITPNVIHSLHVSYGVMWNPLQHPLWTSHLLCVS